MGFNGNLKKREQLPLPRWLPPTHASWLPVPGGGGWLEMRKDCFTSAEL